MIQSFSRSHFKWEITSCKKLGSAFILLAYFFKVDGANGVFAQSCMPWDYSNAANDVISSEFPFFFIPSYICFSSFSIRNWDSELKSWLNK